MKTVKSPSSFMTIKRQARWQLVFKIEGAHITQIMRNTWEENNREIRELKPLTHLKGPTLDFVDSHFPMARVSCIMGSEDEAKENFLTYKLHEKHLGKSLPLGILGIEKNLLNGESCVPRRFFTRPHLCGIS